MPDFGKWVEREYPRWLANLDDPNRPPLSIDIVPRWLAPHLREGKKVYFFVIDCMRLDHWINVEPELAEAFQIDREHYFADAAIRDAILAQRDFLRAVRR